MAVANAKWIWLHRLDAGAVLCPLLVVYLGYHTWVLGLDEVREEMTPWELVLG